MDEQNAAYEQKQGQEERFASWSPATGHATVSAAVNAPGRMVARLPILRVAQTRLRKQTVFFLSIRYSRKAGQKIVRPSEETAE
jgi:hypothetical protein